MDLDEIKQTDTWQLYEKGRNYLRQKNVYSDTDKNYRMYNGDQWYGLIAEGIEKVQYNFIETIVNYKVSTINQSLFGIHYSSDNFESKEFRKTAKKVCEMLDKKAAKVWEKDQLDIKVREISYDSAVNDEGIVYCWFDDESQNPINEVINKNDIQYANEQSSDIQSQPYIIISRRLPVSEAREKAEANGASAEEIRTIIGDRETYESAGEEAKLEKDDMCTLLYKLWKEDGKVWFQTATKYVDIDKPKETPMKLYPVAHFIWQEKKGWSRGEGEVRGLIPNQLELNKTLMRYLLAVKQCAYAQKIVNIDKIANPSSINQIGGTIQVSGGATVDDVSKVISTLQPATMSSDVSKVMNDLITITRELKNSSGIATGGINPEQASGKAILAVQQASQQPLEKQSLALKKFIEDLARIWLDMWSGYTPEGMNLEDEYTDENGEEQVQLVKIPNKTIEALKGQVRIDITPTTPFDKYAKEASLENLLKAGYFNIQRLQELKVYAKILPDDSTMPKQDLLEAIELMEEEQRKIAMINAEAQMMQQRANQFLNSDVEAQAGQINQAMVNQGQ